MYPGLDYDKMNDFGSSHGNATFGNEADKGQTFCAQFVNDLITAGGGSMPDIGKWIDRVQSKLIGMFLKNKSLREIALEAPVPSNLAKDVRNRFPGANKNYSQIKK